MKSRTTTSFMMLHNLFYEDNYKNDRAWAASVANVSHMDAVWAQGQSHCLYTNNMAALLTLFNTSSLIIADFVKDHSWNIPLPVLTCPHMHTCLCNSGNLEWEEKPGKVVVWILNPLITDEWCAVQLMAEEALTLSESGLQTDELNIFTNYCLCFISHSSIFL